MGPRAGVPEVGPEWTSTRTTEENGNIEFESGVESNEKERLPAGFASKVGAMWVQIG
jgi:hypothetical protein